MLVALIPLAIALQGVLANPFAKEPTTAEIFAYIGAKGSINWETSEGPGGVTVNATTFDTALWDEAVSVLSASASVGKRSLVKRDIHCYGSGAWAKRWQVRNSIGDMCRRCEGLGLGQSIRIEYPTRDLPTILFTKINRFEGNWGCVDAMNRILDVCHGENDYTRGGNIWDEFDRNEYAADPN